MSNDLWFNVLTIAPALLVAVILHEIAHGLAAERLGDKTARDQGRITLNPIKHIDPYMTIGLPLFLIVLGSPVVFGGAKPVPVNPMVFKDPRRGMAFVAIAGPLTNFLLMIASYLLIFLGAQSGIFEAMPAMVATVIFYMLVQSVIINLVLGTFNLLPVPPLDGGRIAVGLLPLSIARKFHYIERFGLLIVFGLLLSGALDGIFSNLFEFAIQGLEKVAG